MFYKIVKTVEVQYGIARRFLAGGRRVHLYFSVYGMCENCLWHIKLPEGDNIWHIEKVRICL